MTFYKKHKIKIIFNLLYWPLFLVAIQYYMLFPAKFTNQLTDDFTVNDKLLKTEYQNINGNNLKTIYFQSRVKSAPLLVFLHGNFETIDQNILPLISITEQNLNILMIEYPGYANSSGWPTPSNILVSNLDAIAKYRKNNQKLFIWGRSLGGGNAINLANEIEYDKLILESTFMHPLDYLGTGKFINALKSIFAFNLDSENKLSSLSDSAPILLIHGKNDALFDVSVSHRMLKALTNKHAQQIIHNGGHNERQFDYKEIRAFLNK